MPVGIVKTQADERYWKECRASVPANAKDRWKRVTGCYMKRKANASKSGSWKGDKRLLPKRKSE